MVSKITLLNPKRGYKFEQTPYPPLGLGYIAATLKEVFNKEFDIELIDGLILNKNEYESQINSLDTDYLLVSSTLLQLGESKRVINEKKRLSPSTKIMLGGAGISSLWGQTELEEILFDVAIRGEAEKRLEELIIGDKLSNIPEIAIRNGDEVKYTGGRIEKPDLNKLPWPDRDILNIKKYSEKWKENTGISSVHLLASRGCPYSCTFCDKDVTGNVYRKRNISDVVEEMLHIEAKYHPEEIYLNDDLFTLNEGRVLEFCSELKRRKFKSNWTAQGRVDTTTKKMLVQMASSGCNEICYGVESGSERILEKLNKKITIEQIKKTFENTHEVGIVPGAYFLIGVPGETREDINATIDIMRQIKPGLMNISFLTPFPNTQIYKQTRHLIKEHDYSRWDDFSKTVYEDSVFEIRPEESERNLIDAYRELVDKGIKSSITSEYIR